MSNNVAKGQPQYQLTLACSFLHGFYLHCVDGLQRDINGGLRRVAGKLTSSSNHKLQDCGGICQSYHAPKWPWEFRQSTSVKTLTPGLTRRPFLL